MARVGKGRSGARSRPAKRANGALESEVLAALWAAEEPLTPGEVQASLEADLAYTTVLTTLTNLLAKGLVERTKVGRAHAYQPVVGEADLFAERMRSVLAGGSDRSAVLQRFVEQLEPADESLLRALLHEDG